MPSLAGVLGMSTRRFLLFDGLAALLYGGSYVTAGFLFHNQVQEVMVWFDRMCHGVIGLGVVLVVGYVGYKYALRRRNKRPARRTDLAEKGVDAYAGIPCLDAAKLAAEK
jgi:membrane protein DedA with SNARE-associated domain